LALPTSIQLQIVRPDRLLVDEQVDEVQIPGTEGYFGVLPGHTPLLSALAVGEMWYRQGQEKTYLSIASGFCEVLPDKVTAQDNFIAAGGPVGVRRGRPARAAQR
jgi:F-type H+-transporting ATPase subunit epsilon